MERNYDEVISDRLIQLAQIERNLEQEHSQMEAFDKRVDLTIRRMVKAETRLEATEKRMELFDQKLEKSINDQKELEKKKQELLRAKKRHRKLAGEFIDLWVKLRRLKRNVVNNTK